MTAKPHVLQGWLWSRLPITAANFVIEVEFKISGDSSHLHGDGLALWVTKGRAEPGPVFGNIGSSCRYLLQGYCRLESYCINFPLLFIWQINSKVWVFFSTRSSLYTVYHKHLD